MRIVIGNVFSLVQPETDEEREIYNVIGEQFECFAPGYLYTRAYKLWKKSKGKIGWNGKVAMTAEDGVPTGLVPRLLSCFQAIDFHPTIDDRRAQHGPLQLQEVTVPLRDYQIEAKQAAVRNMLGNTWWPRGVIQLATGGGKTELAAGMIQELDVPTLFVVHRKDLLYQAQKRFRKYGMDPGIVGEGKRDIRPLTCATIQTIWSMSKNESVRWLKEFEQVFFDEAHLIAADLKKGNQFVTVASWLENANMRWGLTATPFIKDEYSNLLLEAVTGQLLYEKRNIELIDEGWLSTPKVTMYRITDKLGVPKSWPDCYDEGVMLHKTRNAKIAELTQTMDPPVLVLVKNVAHGKTLERMTGAPFVYGDTPTPKRIKLANDLVSGNIPCIIASTVWDEGIDLPQIRTLILAGGGKSLIKNLQRLGRGLRLCKGKKEVQVIDFFDQTASRLIDHSRKRKGLWLSEGFEVKIEPCLLMKNSSSSP